MAFRNITFQFHFVFLQKIYIMGKVINRLSLVWVHLVFLLNEGIQALNLDVEFVDLVISVCDVLLA
jgi:hypothetical protein